MSSDPATPPGTDSIDQALTESRQQEYVGDRDLARWTTRIGRGAADLALRASAWVAPNRVLAITLAVGLALMTVLTVLSAGLYDAVTESEGIAGLDRPVLDAAITLRTPFGDRIVTDYTNLGGPVLMPLLAAAIAVALAGFWRQWTPVVLTLVTGLGSLLLTMVGKAVVGRIRPPLADAVAPFETSYSFPSGHSLNSMALAGILAYLLVRRQRTAWARALTITLASAFAVTMGLSRVYLGHHWLTDVLVAWTLALAWLAVVITAHRLFITVRRSARAFDTKCSTS
jgi:membrane-associated phospholipid phosphatase